MLKFENILSQSIVKPKEEDRHREDRVRVAPAHGLFAVADGAGGQGMFAGDWAQYLLDKLPLSPIKTTTEFGQWHEGIREQFYKEKLAIVKANFPDLEQKYEREGSLSTLLVMWYVEEEQKIYLLSCGDSAFFVKTNESFSSTIPYADFMENPYLIGTTKDYPASAIDLQVKDADADATYLLCSDTLAQYILAAYLFTHPTPENTEQLQLVEDDYVRLSQYTIDLRKAGMAEKDFTDEVLKELIAALENEATFKAYLYQLNEQKLLNYDDYSLILIPKRA